MILANAGDPAPDSLRRALLSLEGLSCGDAIGEQFFFMPFPRLQSSIAAKALPPGPWRFTDDTMMAFSIFQALRHHGEIREDFLASHFASLYDPARGCGAAMHGYLLRVLAHGGHTWEEEARSLFGGNGSYGNGAAMRVAPRGPSWHSESHPPAR